MIGYTLGEAAAPHFVRCYPERRENDLRSWCVAACAVHDPALLGVLAPALHRRHPEIDEAFLFLSTILDEPHEQLEAVRKRVHDREMKDPSELFSLSADRDSMEMELKCRECGEVGLYEVRSVFITPDVGDAPPYIADELVCRSCGAPDALEMTGFAFAAVIAEMARHVAALDAGHDIASPVKPVAACLMGGRRIGVAEALDHYADAVKRKPEDMVSWLGLGNCYVNVARTAQAEACFRKCVELDPSCIEAAYSLGQILADEGRNAEAFEVLDAAMEHKVHWRFHKLTGCTPQEFIEAAVELYSEVAFQIGKFPRGIQNMPDFGSKPKGGTPQKTGPNAPCPCGSGKKYKKCCGRIA